MDHSLLLFLTHKSPQLIKKIGQHIYLVGITMTITTCIGVPLGIGAAKSQRLKTSIMPVINILQTIPSLALLALLLPFFGIGATPAIITLVLYALLPVVRNTLTALETIPAHIQEAAKSLGLNFWQQLRLIELPLALPMIIAGMRTATIMAIGIATIAALIGAGGLGDFIYQGIALNDHRLILLGAIPVTLLALAFDSLMATLEKITSPRVLSTQKFSWRIVAASILGLFLLLG